MLRQTVDYICILFYLKAIENSHSFSLFSAFHYTVFSTDSCVKGQMVGLTNKEKVERAKYKVYKLVYKLLALHASNNNNNKVKIIK